MDGINFDDLGTGAQEQTTQAQTTQPQTTAARSRGLLNRFRKASTGSDATLNAFVENLKKMIGNDAVIYVMHKDNYQTDEVSFKYSYVVVARQEGNALGYYVIEPAVTGVAGMRPAEIISTLERPNTPLVIPGIAIDVYVKTEVETLLSEAHKGATLYPCGGGVIQAYVDLEDETTAAVASAYSLNDIIATLSEAAGEDIDAELFEVATSKDFLTRALTTNATGVSFTALGEPRRSMVVAELTGDNRKGTGIQPNAGSGSIDITRTQSFVTVVGTDFVDPNTHKRSYKFSPVIVASVVDSVVPTIGAALLGLADAAELLVGNQWATAMAHNISDTWNPGALNALAGATAEGKHVVVDLTHKKVPFTKRVTEIMKIIDGDYATIALDVHEFSFDASPLVPFVKANMGSQEDAQAIIAAAMAVTNGHFPADYPLDRIFAADAPVKLLDGYIDGAQREPIDSRDIIYMATNARNKGPEFLVDFITTEFSPTLSEHAKTKFLSELPEADKIVVVGRKHRLLFDGMFISTLTKAFAHAGITPQVRDIGMVEVAPNFGTINTIFQRAAVASGVMGGVYNTAQTGGSFYDPMQDYYGRR